MHLNDTKATTTLTSATRRRFHCNNVILHINLIKVKHYLYSQLHKIEIEVNFSRVISNIRKIK